MIRCGTEIHSLFNLILIESNSMHEIMSIEKHEWQYYSNAIYTVLFACASWHFSQHILVPRTKSIFWYFYYNAIILKYIQVKLLHWYRFQNTNWRHFDWIAIVKRCELNCSLCSISAKIFLCEFFFIQSTVCCCIERAKKLTVQKIHSRFEMVWYNNDA